MIVFPARGLTSIAGPTGVNFGIPDTAANAATDVATPAEVEAVALLSPAVELDGVLPDDEHAASAVAPATVPILIPANFRKSRREALCPNSSDVMRISR
jgi:hypothetical protein